MLMQDAFPAPERENAQQLLAWDGAPSETQAHGPAFTARTSLIDREFKRLRPRLMIDIGCGRGHATAVAARHARTVYATDLASSAVDETRRQLSFHRDAHVACADAFRGDWPGCPAPPAKFDAALLSEVLEHIEDDVSMLRNVHTLLAHGGHLVITVPAHMSLWTPWDVVAGHVRRYERSELLAKLEATGFVPVSIRTWGFPITGWLAIRGSRMRGKRVQSHAAEVPGLIARLMPRLAQVFRLLARLEGVLPASDRGAGYVVVARKV